MKKITDFYLLFKRESGFGDLEGVVFGTDDLGGVVFGTGDLPGFVFGTGVLGTLAIKTHACFVIYTFLKKSYLTIGLTGVTFF